MELRNSGTLRSTCFAQSTTQRAKPLLQQLIWFFDLNLVTNDEVLLRHCPVAALSAPDMCKVLEMQRE